MENEQEGKRLLVLPAPGGNARLLDRGIARAPAGKAASAEAPGAEQTPVHDLPTAELVKGITAEVAHLAQKQVELARAELKRDLRAEVAMLGGLSLAGLGGLITFNLLLVSVVLALTGIMPGWAAGLATSACVLVASAATALLAWNKRVRTPLAGTQRTLRDNLQWKKERVA